jgi:hypothetical protein
MISQRTLTIWLLLAGLIFYVAYDLWCAFTPGATISEVTINFFYRHPVVPFTIGALFGHLSWPTVTTRPHSETVAIVCCYVVAAVSAYLWARIPSILPVVPLVLGIPIGHLLWPQRTVTEMGQIETPGAITPTPQLLKK